jgi:prepilin-type N-terminal cleavage/methylation domain-containing protein
MYTSMAPTIAHLTLPMDTADPTRESPESAGERAFTLVEVLVVLAIIAVLMSIIVPRFGSAKTSANGANLRAAAQSYAEAVDAFALDHAGRVPVIGGATSTDWPNTALSAGPLKPSPMVGGTTNTYLGRFVPEVVQGPRADFVTTAPAAGSAAPATGTDGVIDYVPGPVVAPATVPTTYRIEEWAVDQNKRFGPMTCYLGTYAPTTTPAVGKCA